MAKAVFWSVADTEDESVGSKQELDTLVVHALNDACLLLSSFGGLVTKLTR